MNRTLIDYASVVTPLLVERALEDAIRRGYTNEGALRRRLALVGGPGARGAGKLRQVLDLRPAGKPARSGFEVIVLDILRQFGLPSPVRNYVVQVDGEPVAELDLAYPDPMVDIEAMGAKWHSTRRQIERDEHRRTLLRALGWDIVEVYWEPAIRTPEAVAGAVRSALRGSVAA